MRERERECVCVCVCEGESESESERVSAIGREGERETLTTTNQKYKHTQYHKANTSTHTTPQNKNAHTQYHKGKMQTHRQHNTTQHPPAPGLTLRQLNHLAAVYRIYPHHNPYPIAIRIFKPSPSPQPFTKPRFWL